MVYLSAEMLYILYFYYTFSYEITDQYSHLFIENPYSDSKVSATLLQLSSAALCYVSMTKFYINFHSSTICMALKEL